MLPVDKNTTPTVGAATGVFAKLLTCANVSAYICIVLSSMSIPTTAPFMYLLLVHSIASYIPLSNHSKLLPKLYDASSSTNAAIRYSILSLTLPAFDPWKRCCHCTRDSKVEGNCQRLDFHLLLKIENQIPLLASSVSSVQAPGLVWVKMGRMGRDSLDLARKLQL
ncbi:hypothetical protein F5B19DRAFT_466779 [Rostrohypoxylon terebratum]|nr:hypothetical protein F5B19DRAFT_466779 [Rostrohypoxylon terebratum]